MPTQPLSPLEQQQQARVSTITSPPPDEPRRRKRRKKRRKKKPTLLEQLYNYVSSAGGACFGQAPPDKKEKSKKREPRFERGVSFLEEEIRNASKPNSPQNQADSTAVTFSSTTPADRPPYQRSATTVMSAFATSIRKPRRDTPLITRSIAESYDVGPRIGKGAYLRGNQNFTERSSSRRPPRHRRDACSMALQCRFFTARRSQHGHVIAEKRLRAYFYRAPDTLVDLHTGAYGTVFRCVDKATGAVRAVKTVRRSPDSTDEPVGDLDVLNELSSYPTPETPISNKLERSATSQELLAPGRAPLRRAATLLGTLRPGAAKTSIALSGGGALAEPESPTQAAEYYLRQSHIDMDSQLRREIEILSNMHHPHIVELLAVFDDKANDVVHIVMPMCAGGELFDRITKDRTQVKTVDAAVYAQQMLSSIEYLHAQAIVHRDLKPENFMFLTPEEDSDLVLIDFGISTFFHRNKPLNAAIGTVYYTAPEVLDGEYDERCDVWSVGVIVYLIIAGHVPFDDPRKRDNEMRIMKQIRTKEPLYEDSIWNYRGRALEFVQRLLQKNPQQRPSSAKALEDAWFKVEHVTQLAAHAPEIVKQLEAFAKMNAMQRVAHQLLASELTESEIGHLKQQFRLLDADGDGILTAQELQKAIFEIEGELLEDKLNVEITCDFDVEAFIAATCRRPNEGVDPEAMRRAFGAFDRNKDGVLTHDDLVDVLGSESDAKQVLDDVGSTAISMDQFERMVNCTDRDGCAWCGDKCRDATDRDEKEHLTAKGRVKRHANKETLKDVEHMLYNQPLLQPKAKSPTNEGVSPRNHFGGDQWGRSPRSSASTSPMFSTQQTHFAPAADPEKDPVAALGLLASTPLLDRRAQPSPPPRYRSLSKPNSPQKEKTDQWEGV